MNFSKSWLEFVRSVILMVCIVFFSSQMALAQEQKSVIPTRGKAIGPIYNPGTKSYFELRIDLPRPPNWANAVRTARTKFYKGVRGRLAVVPDTETHSFLRANFELLAEAWIGLRYYCSFRKLVWSDGTEHPRSKFKMWARKWHRTDVRCGRSGIPYMPIYYLPSHQGYKWQASGPAKYFPSYFVEYQTGSENPKPAEKSPSNKPGKAPDDDVPTPKASKPEKPATEN